MRLWFRRTAIAFVLLLLAVQLVPAYRRNPPVDRSKTIYATQTVPAGVQAIFARSCNDCHSNETHWPWYSYVAPISWVVANDVHEARRKLNFSEWANYSEKTRDHKLEEICNEVLGGNMPDGKYTFIHRGAHLTETDHEVLCQWTGGAPPQ